MMLFSSHKRDSTIDGVTISANKAVEATEYRRLTANVQRSAVPVHSAAVHVPVHVHEEAMQMDQEGLDENGERGRERGRGRGRGR